MAAATQIEIQSFVDKFSHLSSQGYLSTLNFTCHQGKVSVNFQADLGYMHGTPEPLTHFLTQQRYMKPSQVRRRNRRCETQPVQRNIVENEVSNTEEAIGSSMDADEENIGDNEKYTPSLVSSFNHYGHPGGIRSINCSSDDSLIWAGRGQDRCQRSPARIQAP